MVLDFKRFLSTNVVFFKSTDLSGDHLPCQNEDCQVTVRQSAGRNHFTVYKKNTAAI